MLTDNTMTTEQPVAVLGAGELVSHLYRASDPDSSANYRFNIIRLQSDLETTHKFRPSDLPDLIKLCQVLAFAIEDDGWVCVATRNRMRDLFNDLDEITRRWSQVNHD
jgi:hypothetical protein